MKTIGIILCVFMALWGIHLRGQNIPVTKKFDFSSGLCRTELDSMFVLPSSIDLRYADNQLPVLPHLFEFNFQTSEIVLSDSLCNLNIVLSVSYNTLDIKRKFSVFHKHFDSYHSENNDSLFVRPVSPQKQFTPYESDGLVKQGNISRSVSLGNTQGASLQSSLDIKLSGKLNNDVEILAVITDNSIPVQPEGNTQQIQEFDKVFIELRKNLTMLRVGDIDLTRPEGYFMNYTKKNQGAVLTTGFKTQNLLQNKDSIAHSMQLSGGISKGKFARNIFPGINGNQGPYKLTGAENELFIIILAGTERVFINGEQMTRGQNYDYVIDYNTAELFFTTARLITNDSRIIIEFEYSDKNYVRSLIAGNYNYTGQRLDFRLNLYSEQDSKNQSRQQLLDDNDIFTLQLAGDDPMAAVVPGWDSVGFSGNYVLYAMVDSMGYDSVFVYSINPENAKYSVHFSFVGKNKGNYIQDKIPANGRVFKWIQPVGGIPQGEYEPYEVVIAPKKSQMASVGLDFRIAERTVAGFELAMSNNDLNTFSSIGDNNNTGTAGRFYMKHISILSRDSLSPVFTLHEEVIYEFVEARFTQIDRFRPVEFDRDWNILPEDSRSNEHIMSGVLSLYKKAKRPLMFRSDYFIKAGKFTGNRNLLHIDVQNSKINIRNKIMFMNSDLQTLKTSFFSQKGLVFVPAGPLVIGAAFDHEINNFKLGGDSLSERSYSFAEIEPYIANSSDSANINFRLWYKTRQSKGVYMGILDDALITNESGIKFRTEISPQNSISLSGVYRVTNVKDTTRTNINDDRSILSRFEHNFRFFNGSITSFMFYEIGSGLESKKEFSYIEVAQGQGQFTWIDYNQNGIKELDEFETANYQDEASYIRILFPSGDYIRVFTLQLNETLILEPMRAWKNDTTFLKSFLSRFSDRFQYAAGKKTTSDDFSERFLPWMGNISDTSIISVTSGLSNTVFFNRAHPVFSARYRYSDHILKALLLNGFETRRTQLNELHCIWNATKSFGIEMEWKNGTVMNNSDVSFQKNYTILMNEFSPVFNLQPSVKQRYSFVSRYRISESQTTPTITRAVIFSAGPDIRIPVFDKHTINFKFLYHQITYSGPSNSALSYELLNSLEPGRNFTWNLMLQLSVSKAFMLNFMYEGRLPQNRKTIHFGSVQLKALL